MLHSDRKQSTQRLTFLDALRGVAVLAVMIHHACGDLQLAIFQLFNFGRLGVVLFFLCSGFVIPSALDRNSQRVFWLGRILRLYPMYWCSLGGALLLGAIGLHELPADYKTAPLATVVSNATMLQFFLGVADAQFSYWTLAFELFFYAILSLLVASRLTNKGIPFIAVGLAIVLIVCDILPLAFDATPTVPTHLVCYLLTMFVGATIYRVYTGAMSRRIGGGIIAFALLSLLAALLAQLEGITGGPLFWRAIPPWLCAFGFFGAALLSRQRRFPRWLVGAGTISYSLYLWNMLVFAAIPPLGPPLVTITIWFAATIALSVATYRWVERPCIALGRLLIDRFAKGTRPLSGASWWVRTRWPLT